MLSCGILLLILGISRKGVDAMVFSSLEFIFIFLPVFLVLYYLLPARLRNTCLLIGSFVFYLCGSLHSPFHIVLLLLSIGVNWLLGLALAPHSNSESGNRTLLIIGIIYNLGLLFIYKYCGFLFNSINALFRLAPHKGLPQISWLLPLGISFYTFMHLAYLIDVYHGRIQPERKFLRYATFSTFFPKLTSGPITTYQELANPLSSRSINIKRLDNGLRDFIIGLGLKVLLANQIGGLWNQLGMIGYDSISTPLAWLGSISYSLQLYFDFYGYSLMAIGLGKFLGFRLPDNFRHPYVARTMTDFWRRWHITLGMWFRNYLYIPLGGNKCSHRRHTLNLLIVWLATGLWHGASWNFVLWGLFLFIILYLEKNYTMNLLTGDSAVSRIGSHIYMILLILIQWTIFAIPDLHQLGIYLGRLFGIGGTVIDKLDYVRYLGSYGWKLVLGILFSTPLPKKLFKPIRNTTIGTILLFIIFAVAVYCMSIGSNDPFMYFNF